MSLPSNALLTAHFTAGELRADLPGVPAGVVANLRRVAEYLEIVRATLDSPLRVTSGYRPPAYNASVGGASSSSHMDGLAADVVPVRSGLTMYQAYRALSTASLPPFDQIIFYPVQGHIHVGLGSRMRREFRISFSSDPGGTPILAGGLIAQLPGYVSDAVTAVASNPSRVTLGAVVLIAAAVLLT